MYLHIGGNCMIDVHQLVAFFQAHPRRSSKANPLKKYYRPYKLVDGISQEDVRSYIVTEAAVYGSHLSVKTLAGRYAALFSID